MVGKCKNFPKGFLCFTGRNEVVAKVIFLQASVCPQGDGPGGVCIPGGGGVSTPGGCLVGGWSAPGEVWSWGGLWSRGVFFKKNF